MKKLIATLVFNLSLFIFHCHAQTPVDSIAILHHQIDSLQKKVMTAQDFIEIYKYEKIITYYKIVKRKPTQSKYFWGWVRRTIEE